MTTAHRVVDSPLGPIDLGADSSGRLTEVRIATQGARHADDDCPAGPDPGPDTRRVLDVSAKQLEEYFGGRRRRFDLPVAMAGTAFQLQVWARLRDIPFGTTVSYGQLAAELGRPGAARAVGHANARNPVAIIVPCHRVIGSSGQLTGYGGGLRAKAFLLDLEAQEIPARHLPVAAAGLQSSA